MDEDKRIVNFLFEVGTMRKLARAHRQFLLEDDLSDSIASHSFRVALIGWHLAKAEGADLYKTLTMCLIHDLSEARSGDPNYVNKKYIKVFADEIIKDQLGTLPYDDLEVLAKEYEKRDSAEAILAKDADLLDQILLLREYEWRGNKEATIWLKGKGEEKENGQFSRLQSKAAKKWAVLMMQEDPSAWWTEIRTSENK